MKYFVLTALVWAVASQAGNAQDIATESLPKPGAANVKFQNEITLQVSPFARSFLNASRYERQWGIGYKHALKTGFLTIDLAYASTPSFGKVPQFSGHANLVPEYSKIREDKLAFGYQHLDRKFTFLSIAYEYRVPLSKTVSLYVSGGPYIGYSNERYTDFEQIWSLDNPDLTLSPSSIVTLKHVHNEMIMAGMTGNLGIRAELSDRVAIFAQVSGMAGFSYGNQTQIGSGDVATGKLSTFDGGMRLFSIGAAFKF